MAKTILRFLINLLARTYVFWHRPKIIAITGNVGKTSTKEAIGAVLSKLESASIRIGAGNLNNEWGVPLSIIGGWDKVYYREGGSIIFWLKVLASGIFKIFLPKYPDILVLEFGADKPGDIKKLSKIFKPTIAVVTAVGEIPVHVEFFASPKAVAYEKSKLVESLKDGGSAVLNFDDLSVLEMKDKTKERVLTFGFGEGADVRIMNFDTRINSVGIPEGISFKLSNKDSFVPVKIDNVLGKGAAAAAAAAAAVGIIFDMNLVEISSALSEFNSPPGRLKMLKGIKNTLIIDDTYNASPASTRIALEALRSLPGKRKIAVLGDMLELGKYTVQAHQAVGNFAGNFVNLLICVGDRAKFIADSAGNQMRKENIFVFNNSEEAKTKVQKLIEEGDVILVKGSQGMRMEKIVEEIMAEPELKSKLLVRQSKGWLEKNSQNNLF